MWLTKMHMKKLIIIIIFFSIVSIIECQKLSEGLDAERSEQCGQPNKISTSKSKNPKEQLAPWMMALHVKQNKETFFSPAILISPRHLISPSYSVVYPKEKDSKIWNWLEDPPLPVVFEDCKDNVMKVPKKVIDRLSAKISVCEDPEICGTKILRKIVEAHYIGNCQPGELPLGIILLEISSNVPEEPYFVPVCIPEAKKPYALDEKVNFHVLEDVNNNRDRKINSIETTIKNCDPAVAQFVFSICPSGCGHHGALVKKISGRDTLIAMSYHSDTKECKQTHFASVAHFNDKICDLAGICKAPTESTSSSVNQLNVGLIIGLAVIIKWLTM